MARPLKHPETITFRANAGKTAEAMAFRMPVESPGEFWRRVLHEWLAGKRRKGEGDGR